jgi:hypothetical protein
VREPDRERREHTTETCAPAATGALARTSMESAMVEKSSTNLGRVSRRDFLFAAGVAGGAAAAVALSSSPALASNKMSQKAMSYRPSPNGNQRCDNCGNFQAPSSCKLVDGAIAPTGWCVLYRPK